MENPHTRWTVCQDIAVFHPLASSGARRCRASSARNLGIQSLRLKRKETQCNVWQISITIIYILSTFIIIHRHNIHDSANSFWPARTTTQCNISESRIIIYIHRERSYHRSEVMHTTTHTHIRHMMEVMYLYSSMGGGGQGARKEGAVAHFLRRGCLSLAAAP